MKTNLFELRKSLDKTQKEVADYLGVTYQAYQRYENGTREADYATLCKLADFFNVSIDFLLGHEEKQPLMERPNGSIAENIIKEFKELFADEYFCKFARVYKNAEEKVRITAISYILGYLQKSGVDVSAAF